MISFYPYLTFEQTDGSLLMSLIHMEIENGTEHLNTHHIALYDERLVRIFGHLKITFTVYLYLTVGTIKLFRIFDGSKFVEPDLSSIR